MAMWNVVDVKWRTVGVQCRASSAALYPPVVGVLYLRCPVFPAVSPFRCL